MKNYSLKSKNPALLLINKLAGSVKVPRAFKSLSVEEIIRKAKAYISGGKMQSLKLSN